MADIRTNANATSPISNGLNFVQSQFVDSFVLADQGCLVIGRPSGGLLYLDDKQPILRLAVPSVPSARLGMGGVALVLLLVAEFELDLWLCQHMPYRLSPPAHLPAAGENLSSIQLSSHGLDAQLLLRVHLKHPAHHLRFRFHHLAITRRGVDLLDVVVA